MEFILNKYDVGTGDVRPFRDWVEDDNPLGWRHASVEDSLLDTFEYYGLIEISNDDATVIVTREMKQQAVERVRHLMLGVHLLEERKASAPLSVADIAEIFVELSQVYNLTKLSGHTLRLLHENTPQSLQHKSSKSWTVCG